MRAVLLLAALAACDGYDEDLGPTPFLCGPEDACPSGYTCTDDPANDRKVCVGDGDSINGNFECNDDSAFEPNDMLAMAEPTDATKSFDRLSICPVGDRDLFAVMISSAGANLEADVTFQANGSVLRAAILNTGGVPIAEAAVLDGAPMTLHVIEPELPAGLYYVQVTAEPDAPAVNNYALSIEVVGP
jgi:hypothetical protein